MRKSIIKTGIFAQLSSIILIFIASCNQSNDTQVNQLLERADSLMFIAPDSSLALINSLSSPEMLRGEQKALYALLMTQAKARNNIPHTSDSLIKTACDYYSEQNDNERLAWACLYMSDINYNHDNDSLAIVYINKAAKAAEKIKNDRLHYYIHQHWGYYLNSNPYSREYIDHFIKAHEHAKAFGYTEGEIFCLTNIAYAHLWTKEDSIANSYFDQAINLAKENPEYYQYLSMICNAQTTGYIHNKDYRNALTCNIEAIKYIPYIKSFGDSLRIFTNRAEIFMGLGRTDSVEYYLNKGLREETEAEKAVNELNFSRLEELRGDYRAALERRKNYGVHLDSAHAADLRDRALKWQREYDLLEVAAERDRLKIRSQKSTILILSLTIVLLLISAAAIFMIRRKKEEIDELKDARRRILADAMAQAQEKIQTIAEQSMQRVRRMGDYILEINDTVKRIRSLQSLTVKEKIRSKSQLVLSETERDELIHAIDIIHEGLLKRLAVQYDRLTPDDLAVCTLTLLHSPAADMAMLLDCSEQALLKRRYRIKEKLGIDADTSLHDWLTAQAAMHGDKAKDAT